VQPRLSRLVIEVCQYPESISRVPLELFSYGDMHRDMRARDSFDVLDLGFERIAEAFFRIAYCGRNLSPALIRMTSPANFVIVLLFCLMRRLICCEAFERQDWRCQTRL